MLLSKLLNLLYLFAELIIKCSKNCVIFIGFFHDLSKNFDFFSSKSIDWNFKIYNYLITNILNIINIINYNIFYFIKKFIYI